jgi:hypothetical protein
MFIPLSRWGKKIADGQREYTGLAPAVSSGNALPSCLESDRTFLGVET